MARPSLALAPNHHARHPTPSPRAALEDYTRQSCVRASWRRRPSLPARDVAPHRPCCPSPRRVALTLQTTSRNRSTAIPPLPNCSLMGQVKQGDWKRRNCKTAKARSRGAHIVAGACAWHRRTPRALARLLATTVAVARPGAWGPAVNAITNHQLDRQARIPRERTPLQARAPVLRGVPQTAPRAHVRAAARHSVAVVRPGAWGLASLK